MRRVRDYVTYANVMSTIAVVLVIGGGAAYAADTIFSSDIVDGEVKTADIGNNQIRSQDVRDDALAGGGLTGDDIGSDAVGSSDVLNDSLTGDDINEGALRTPQNAFGGGSCNPNSATFVTCASRSLTLAETGAGAAETVFIATVLWDTNTAGAAGLCSFAINGVNTSIVYPMGETTDTTDAGHPGETTMVGQFGGLPGETKTYSIRCNENESDINYRNVSVVFTGAITG